MIIKMKDAQHNEIIKKKEEMDNMKSLYNYTSMLHSERIMRKSEMVRAVYLVSKDILETGNC